MDCVDCRSEEGITISLIDTIITITYLLKERDLKHPAVVEALRDLRSAPEFTRLLEELTNVI